LPLPPPKILPRAPAPLPTTSALRPLLPPLRPGSIHPPAPATNLHQHPPPRPP
ncbi:MAG: hypothetical protein M1830_007699, partial [Pleopsidium flavum]